jgi:hypothetical protein
LESAEVSGGPLVLADSTEVSDFEQRYWIRFPDGYRDYVTQLGEGVLGGDFVGIYPPWRIEKELAEWRHRINKYWVWDAGDDVLPKQRALECIIVGDTLNGDELVFHPQRPEKVLVLPRGGESIFVAGGDLLTAIDWVCNSGELTEPFSERVFEPFDSRKEPPENGQEIATIVDPQGESMDELVELLRRWAKRHNALDSARKALRERIAKDKTTSLLFEAVVTKEGERPEFWWIGYHAVFCVKEKGSGVRVGTFDWHMDDGSSGSCYSPYPERQ